MAPAAEAGGAGGPSISIPEVRDYQRINAELVRHLDAGHGRVRLVGAEGQRLLAAGLAGAWEAVIEIEGFAGPELAAGTDAPGLSVVCRGPAADGAGSRLRNGRVMVLGDAGPAVGYAQSGGTIVVSGDAGPRAGLNQSGGVLVLLGSVGPLAGERQSGGYLFAFGHRLGAHAFRAQSGGRFILMPQADALDPDGCAVLRAIMEEYTRTVDGR